MAATSQTGFLDDVKIRKIRPSTQSLRPELGRLDELMISIEKVGLLQPIVIRPLEDSFEVVAGNRRFEACKKLGWIKVPCHIVELDDKEAYEVSLIENVQRNMLNPIEEAFAFKKYVKDYGWGGVTELALQIGKSQAYISKRIRLLDLPEDLQKDILNNRVSPSVGEEILSLDNKEVQLNLGIRAVNENLSRNDVRKIVRNLKENNEYLNLIDSIPYTYSDLERQQRITDRALTKSIAALKVALHRMDDSIELLEEEWVFRELLFEHRKTIHSQIDSLLKLRKRLSKNPISY